jgi:hypothetical protein
MYLVISRWEPLVGKETEFLTRSKTVIEALRKSPGVLFVHTIYTGGISYAVHAYENEEAYRKVQETGGEFERIAKESKIEEVGRWLGSDKGNTLD